MRRLARPVIMPRAAYGGSCHGRLPPAARRRPVAPLHAAHLSKGLNPPLQLPSNKQAHSSCLSSHMAAMMKCLTMHRACTEPGANARLCIFGPLPPQHQSKPALTRPLTVPTARGEAPAGADPARSRTCVRVVTIKALTTRCAARSPTFCVPARATESSGQTNEELSRGAETASSRGNGDRTQLRYRRRSLALCAQAMRGGGGAQGRPRRPQPPRSDGRGQCAGRNTSLAPTPHSPSSGAPGTPVVTPARPRRAAAPPGRSRRQSRRCCCRRAQPPPSSLPPLQGTRPLAAGSQGGTPCG